MRSIKTSSKIMAAVKSKDTKPEKKLGSALWSLGIRYRKQYKIVGKPDFVLVSTKIAIFCDGDFWHGNNWKIRGLRSFAEELSSYTPYWKRKILRNVERDKEVNEILVNNGWVVLRFWESEIKNNAIGCAETVLKEHLRHKLLKCL